MRRRLARLAGGLLFGIRGLTRKELQTRSRGWRPMWLLSGYLALLTAAVAGFLALAERSNTTISPYIGTQLFGALAISSVLLLGFITPALTAGAISGERERRTLDLLLVSRASALGLAGGKLLASLLSILYLLAAALPAFALVYLFGGVPPAHLAVVLAIAVATALSHAALGLLLSALLRRTVVASVVAYLVVLAVMVALPFAWLLFGLAGPGGLGAVGLLLAFPDLALRTGIAPAAWVYASPLVSLLALLPGALGGPLPWEVGASRTGPLPITMSAYAIRDPRTGQVETLVAWAPWIYTCLFSAAFILFSILVTALALMPVKPWHRRRRGPRRARVEARAGS